MKHVFQHKSKAGRVVRHTKRYIAAIVALLLTLVISATALADNGKSNGGSGGPSKQGGSSSQQPQNSPKPSPSADDQKDKQNNGVRNNEKPGVNTDKIAEAIAALDDETAQASLTALLETYEAALDAKQAALDAKDTEELDTLASAVGAAKEALDAALEEAGVSTDDLYGVPAEASDGTGRMQNRPAMDTTEIAAEIAALDDTDENKATLTSLLEAYATALAAQNGADFSALTNDEIKVLVDAVQSAEQALLEATKAAGITGGVGRGQFVNGYGNASLDAESIATKIAALDDTNANKASLTALLEAYETALAAQNGADASSRTEEEIQALADATNKAELALEEALMNAGLAEEPIREQNQQTVQYQPQTTQDQQFQLDVVSDGTDGEDANTETLFSAFLQWLSNLVK